MKPKLTKLEKLDPELTAMAEALGHTIERNPWHKAYLLMPGCQRLTALADCDPITARRVIQDVATARTQPEWGTVPERAKRVIDALHKARYRHGCITEYTHISGDKGHMSCFMGVFDVSVQLFGLPQMSAADNDYEQAFAKATRIYGETA